MGTCRTYIKQLTPDDKLQTELQKIHDDIFQQVIGSKLFHKWNGYYFLPAPPKYAQAKEFVNSLNKKYGVPVAGTDFTKAHGKEYIFVNVKNMLWSLEGEQIQEEIKEEQKPTDVLFQKETTSESSPETIAKIKEFAKRSGINIMDLATYSKMKGMNVEGVNGVADVIANVIAVAEGMENSVLPEEAFHIAVEILEQTNPELVTSLISKVGQFQMYDEVFAQYKDDKFYQTADGKPNIRKIKKEAVAKLLVEVVNNNGQPLTSNPALQEKDEYSPKRWWDKILNWISNLYKKSNVMLFQETADIILNTNIGHVSDIQTDESPFFQKSQETVKRLDDTDKLISKEYKIEGDTDSVLQAEEEANNWYVKLVDGEWIRIKNRVTDRVKKWYGQIFKNKPAFTPEEKELNEAKRTLGIDGHAAIEGIIDRLVDPATHKLRDFIEDRPQFSPIKGDGRMETYSKLEAYVIGLINQFPKDSLFYKEKIIYDSKYDEAGTIDLLVLEPTPKGYKAHILDWKFMGDNPNQADVASYKQGGYNIQLGRYKEILKNEYDVEQFGQTRAIPIMMEIAKFQASGEWFLKGISIGSANPKDIEQLKLLPVPLLTERTGVKAIDKVLDRLNNVFNKIKGEKVEEELRATKRERMLLLKAAIRVIQTQQDLSPLHEAMQLYTTQLKSLLEEYNTIKGDISKLSQDRRNEIADDFIDLTELSGYYSNTTTELKDILEKDSEIYNQILAVQGDINQLEADLSEAKRDFADRIGEANNIFGLLKPEKVIRSLFKSFDEYSNRAARLIVTLFNRAEAEATEESTDFNKEISQYTKNIKDYTPLMQKEGHVLIDEISKEFFTQFKATKGEERTEFVKENITDFDAYSKEVIAVRDKKIAQIQKRPPLYNNPEFEKQAKQQEIDRVMQDYNPLSPSSANAVLLKHLNKDKWLTSEYKALSPDLKAFYKKVQELNDIAFESGYIEYAEKRTFLPFMEKSLLDQLASNGWNITKLPKEFINSLNASDRGHGDYSEITGQKTNTLPKPFTKAPKIEKNGKFVVDTSKLSTEIGQSVIRYAEAMFKFKAMSSIDEQIQLILDVEKQKDKIETNFFGDAILETNEETGEQAPKLTPGNEKNAETLSNFVQRLLYNNRYPYSQDTKIFGKSVIKGIDAANRAMQIKTLGGNPISGAVNWFGANIQQLAQANNYFTSKEFQQQQFSLKRMMQWGEPEADKFVKLVDLFNPFTENENYKLFKQASTSIANKINLADVFMFFMRKTESIAETSVFGALLKNIMVGEDGNLVNITDFVKAKYSDRYSQGAVALKEANKKIEEEIAHLKETASIEATATIKDGKLDIPGFDVNNKDEVHKLSILSKTLYRRITGNVSGTSVNKAKLDAYMNSAMVFKNWIPKLWYTRFGSLEQKNDPFDRDAFDVGRVKVFWTTLTNSITDRTNNISAILKGSDKGIEALDSIYTQYAEEYKQSTGEDFTMDKAKFNDMIVTNLSNQMRELGILLMLLSASIALGFVEPPDDDKRAKAAIRITSRIADQFVQELSFFYNPINFQQMLSGGIFPALGLIKDVEKFTFSTAMEITGFDLSHPNKSMEDVRKDAHPAKYALKLFPLSSAWLQYLTIISPELAKEMAVELPQNKAR